MKKFLPFAFVLAAAFLIWLVWLKPGKPFEEEHKPETEAPVRVARISRQTLRSYITAYGNVEPAPGASARLAASSPGVVTAVNCVEGQRVEKNAILFQLDSRASELAVSFAEKTFERQRKLAQAEAASQKAVQESEQQLSAARAQLALLQIRSPFAGTIARVNVKVGEAADLTTVLAEVIDTDKLIASCNVPSSELRALKIGQAAEIVLSDTTNTLASSISFISPQIDPKTDLGIARLAIPIGANFRAGEFIRVRIVTAEKADCLAVPEASVAKVSSGASFVALIDEEKAILKPVKTGLRDGGWLEVEGEGLKAGQTVVTEGAYGIIATGQPATNVRIAEEQKAAQ